MMKAESVTAESDTAGPDHAQAREGGVGQAGPLLLRDEPIAIGLLIGEFKRIGRPELGIQFFKGAVVKDLLHPVEG